MTNDIRILSVLRKYYEEKALSTNSQEDADIHNALLHAIKALESSIHIPSNATNGDVIKAVFPNVQINAGEVYYKVYTSIPYGDIVGANIDCIKAWWNAPYREENNDAEH